MIIHIFSIVDSPSSSAYVGIILLQSDQASVVVVVVATAVIVLDADDAFNHFLVL